MSSAAQQASVYMELSSVHTPGPRQPQLLTKRLKDYRSNAERAVLRGQALKRDLLQYDDPQRMDPHMTYTMRVHRLKDSRNAYLANAFPFQGGIKKPSEHFGSGGGKGLRLGQAPIFESQGLSMGSKFMNWTKMQRSDATRIANELWRQPTQGTAGVEQTQNTDVAAVNGEK